jgi:hypothetical protein
MLGHNDEDDHRDNEMENGEQRGSGNKTSATGAGMAMRPPMLGVLPYLVENPSINRRIGSQTWPAPSENHF